MKNQTRCKDCGTLKEVPINVLLIRCDKCGKVNVNNSPQEPEKNIEKPEKRRLFYGLFRHILNRL